MSNLAARIARINKEIGREIEIDYKDMTLEELGTMTLKMGKAHTGKTYQSLWENEPKYCQWVAAHKKEEGVWAPLHYYLQMKTKEMEKALDLPDIKISKEKGKASTNQSGQQDIPTEQDGRSQIGDSPRSNKNEMMLEQILKSMENLTQRLQEVEAATHHLYQQSYHQNKNP
jgi:hypothetical protein